MKQETAEHIRAEMRRGYDAAASEASEVRQRLYGEELKRFVDYVREKEAILDVGCGDGRAFEVFRDKHVSYAGIDISEEVIVRARARLKDEAAFEVGDILELPV